MQALRKPLPLKGKKQLENNSKTKVHSALWDDKKMVNKEMHVIKQLENCAIFSNACDKTKLVLGIRLACNGTSFLYKEKGKWIYDNYSI